jgi:hypothetical protein
MPWNVHFKMVNFTSCKIHLLQLGKILKKIYLRNVNVDSEMKILTRKKKGKNSAIS